ncbi:MAG: lysophospholipid acyltransferase family protein [Bacillota bacterium]|nr:lysophospholipid acyltransferase family protein [Bacillota bacterium]
MVGNKYSGPNKVAAWVCMHFVPAYTRLAGCDYEIIGAENIPKEPALFVGNHQGVLDVIMILFALNGPKIIMAKKEAKNVPIAHLWMTLLRCIFIDRKNMRNALKCIEEAEDQLSHGQSVLIFPEGTRSRGPEMNPFKHGAFKAAIKTNVPIVPFAIDGSYKVFEDNMRLVKSKVKFSILKPIMPLEGETATKLSIRVQDIIGQELVRLRNE